MQYIPWIMKTNMRLHNSIQHNKMECRHLGLSTFWCVDVLACRCFGLSTFLFVDFLVGQRFGLSMFWFVDVLVCRRFSCRRFGLLTFWPVTLTGSKPLPEPMLTQTYRTMSKSELELYAHLGHILVHRSNFSSHLRMSAKIASCHRPRPCTPPGGCMIGFYQTRVKITGHKFASLRQDISSLSIFQN